MFTVRVRVTFIHFGYGMSTVLITWITPLD